MGRRRFTSIEEYNSEYALFAAIIGQLWRMSYPELQRLALNADVSLACLYNWRNGATLTPRLDTLTRVSRALGFEMTLTASRKLRRVK